ncbi:MAG: hypothetical protein MUD14_23655 [Hydrococcus sp. Prado102]|nr:hypothetical protein [Hydrococcus sp. Prado102]
MTGEVPPIYFYIPEEKIPRDMPSPQDAYEDVYWQGFSEGIYCWTLRTYLYLRAVGFPCQLIGHIPSEGMVLAHQKSLPIDLKPNPKLLIVCLQADRGRHPYAQIHVVQNPRLTKPRILGDRYLLPARENLYMPLWPQSGIIPRDRARGSLFENVAFFGLEINLALELSKPSWSNAIADLGLRWQIINSDRWHDYSDVDVVLAVRDFGKPDTAWDFKPATKLFNAWHAGVPAILGCESAYRGERKSELDFVEVKSLNETIAALKRLRDDRALRQAMVEHGWLRAQETQRDAMIQRWKTLMNERLIPAYENWCNSSWYRQSFWLRRQLATQTLEKRKSVQKLRNLLGIRSRMRSLLSKSS